MLSFHQQYMEALVPTRTIEHSQGLSRRQLSSTDAPGAATRRALLSSPAPAETTGIWKRRILDTHLRISPNPTKTAS